MHFLPSVLIKEPCNRKNFRLDESQVSIGQSLEIFPEKKCRKISQKKCAVIATMLIVDDCQRKIGLLYAKTKFFLRRDATCKCDLKPNHCCIISHSILIAKNSDLKIGNIKREAARISARGTLCGLSCIFKRGADAQAANFPNQSQKSNSAARRHSNRLLSSSKKSAFCTPSS